MAEFCLDCWNRLSGNEFTEKDIINQYIRKHLKSLRDISRKYNNTNNITAFLTEETAYFTS